MTNRSRPGVTVAAAITGAVLVAVVGCSATHSPAPSPAGTSTSSAAGTSTSSPGGTSTSSSDAGSSTSAIAATCTTSSPQGQCPPYGSQVQGEPYPGIVG